MDPVEQIVELRLLAEALDPQQRRRLARLARAARAGLGVGVPKHRAARILGITPQALERWVRTGAIPTVRRPGSSRELIDADGLLELATEVARGRERQETRPVARAVHRLRERGRLRRRLRPNMSSAELRRDQELMTAAQRLDSGLALAEFSTQLAAAGRRSRARADRAG